MLVHNWYRSTSTCFHVYSREYTCSAWCHEFDTSCTGSELVRFHWYDTPNLFTQTGEFMYGNTWIEPVELGNSLTEHVMSRYLLGKHINLLYQPHVLYLSSILTSSIYQPHGLYLSSILTSSICQAHKFHVSYLSNTLISCSLSLLNKLQGLSYSYQTNSFDLDSTVSVKQL